MEQKKRSFWKRPEGKTGIFFLLAVLFGGGYLLVQMWPLLVLALSNILYLSAILMVLGVITYMILDPRMRNMVWYMYKSVMRWITGFFIRLDPISILKSYIKSLEANLRKLTRQVNQLRSQMHTLMEIIHNNQKEIQENLELAARARDKGKKSVMILKSRKAGRLQSSNEKLEVLHQKMEILYRVLNKMRENSEIMVEDIRDQVMVKEQERKAIIASNSAMRSAMNIINGSKDKRAIFDEALEVIAEDVSNKVGEMERFMEMSENFMQSVDLQNGVFEEEGLKMLEKWDEEGMSFILGEEKQPLLVEAKEELKSLDLNQPRKEAVKVGHQNQYDNLFEE